MRCQFTREVRLDDGQVGDLRRALGCLGRANLRIRFPLAVSGKITQIFSRDPKLSGECQYKQPGIGRETHKMMLDHYQQTKNLLVSFSPNALGFF